MSPSDSAKRGCVAAESAPGERRRDTAVPPCAGNGAPGPPVIAV